MTAKATASVPAAQAGLDGRLDAFPFMRHTTMMSESTPARTVRGIWLALITVVAWSVLPITLRIASRHLDPYTLTWYRFAVSAVVLGGMLMVKRRLPARRAVLVRRCVVLLLAATLGLVTNYVLYLVSLSYVSPTAGTVITQLAPL
ncbi:MAG TPA: DMT family transporter, partial [Gemmatimonadaceae bacterium]|nr:DMT family transporter [Gemmatimonadaceae bacterium]